MVVVNFAYTWEPMWSTLRFWPGFTYVPTQKLVSDCDGADWLLKQLPDICISLRQAVSRDFLRQRLVGMAVA